MVVRIHFRYRMSVPTNQGINHGAIKRGVYHAFLLSYDLGPPNPLIFQLYREKKELERGGRGAIVVEMGTEKIRQQKKSGFLQYMCFVNFFVTEAVKEPFVLLILIQCRVRACKEQ
jgi:hypothetical protein